jgi:hypothetical protein
MTLRQFQAAMLFYKYNCVAPALLSVLCCVVYRANGYDLSVGMSCKLATDMLAGYFIIVFNSARLYYYYNLHVSKTQLLVSCFIIDLLLFGIGLWITRHFL